MRNLKGGGSFEVVEEGRYALSLGAGWQTGYIPLLADHDPTEVFPWLATRLQPYTTAGMNGLNYHSYWEDFANGRIGVYGNMVNAGTVRLAYQILKPPSGVKVQQARPLVSLSPTGGIDVTADIPLVEAVDPARAWPILNSPSYYAFGSQGMDLNVTAPTTLHARANYVLTGGSYTIPYVVLY